MWIMPITSSNCSRYTGKTRVAVVADQFDCLRQRHIRPHGDDIGARDHHVVGGRFAQPQHVRDEQALVTVEFRSLSRNLLCIRRFLHQLGYRVAEGMFRLFAAKQIAQSAKQSGRDGRS